MKAMKPEEERRNIIEAIEHLEKLLWAATDPGEIFEYTRQIVKWRKKLEELEHLSEQ